MADLAGRAATRELPAVHHDAAADAGAPEDAEERVEPAAGAEPVLGVHGHVDVVAELHGPAELRGESGPELERGIPPFDVRDLEHGARLGVDLAGRADTDTGQPHRLDARIVERRAEGLRELEGDRDRAALARCLPTRAAEHGRLAVR